MNRLSQHRRLQLLYVAADILSAEIVWILFLLFRWMVYEGLVFSVDRVLIPAFSFYRPLILYPIGCLIIYYLSGYYLRPAGKALTQELATTFLSSIVIVLGAFFIIIIDDKVVSYQRYYISLIVLFLLQFTVSYLPRLSISLWTRRHTQERVYTLSEATDEAINELKRAMPIDRVHISLPEGTAENVIYSVIGKVYPLRVSISLPPRRFDILSGAASIFDLHGQPLIMITEHKMTDMQLAVKRATDVVVSLTGLLLLSPFLLILAIAVYATSKGPAIYSQERIGLYGKPFRIFKFRTMKENAEESVPQLTNTDDPRITGLGRFLRKYRLDELPQLWNVLRGDMSLVGPRPERQYFIDLIMQRAPYYCLLYQIRPGLTSWGPIRVGYTDTIDKMIERLDYDIAYMENMSIRLDLKIMFYTLSVLFNGKGQ
ncbi:MAG: exopolysaccharide biosynthesis polyprenyl glycosylphosphotransferase [Paludibacteraceae bacterium]|nr:exopolysaccharide biosynthesis polyprenyl glycosylphosphotransferase [Paludibacteraceae bacterium]